MLAKLQKHYVAQRLVLPTRAIRELDEEKFLHCNQVKN